MVRFRDTDPRPLEPQPGEIEEVRKRQGFIDAIERDRALRDLERSPFRPADPPGYGALVAQANRIAAERYPLNGDADLWAYSQRAHLDRAAFVAGYVEAVLTAGTIRP